MDRNRGKNFAPKALCYDKQTCAKEKKLNSPLSTGARRLVSEPCAKNVLSKKNSMLGIVFKCDVEGSVALR
jgi:hypothetical protein